MNTKHGIFLAMFGILVFCVFIGTASGATIYVPDDYAKIEWAIDNATGGDTIIVRDGTYIENVDVNKRLTIRSENGPANCIVDAAAANPYYHVFKITADYVNISGFTVKGAIKSLYHVRAGIYLYGADYCNISSNNCSNNNAGIYLRYSHNNIISNNFVSNNTGNGMYLYESNNNRITNNNANSNDYGISLTSSSNNIIENNTASFQGEGEGWPGGSGGSCYYGIRLGESPNTIIANNEICSNLGSEECIGYGIRIGNSKNSTITGNNVSDNDRGIDLDESPDSKIANNNISGNRWGGIELGSDSIVINNNVWNCSHGILLLSNSSKIANNNLSNNTYGIYFGLRGGTIVGSNVIENNVLSNNKYGIQIDIAPNNKLRNNIMFENKYNFGVDGLKLSAFCQDIDTSNLINGKPIYYWVNEKDKQVPNDAGYVGIVNSTNITIKDLTLTDNLQGVVLAYVNSSVIENVNASNSEYGIYIKDSSYNIVTNSNANSNEGYGIYFRDSSNNTIADSNANFNEGSGIYLSGSSNNNMINNSALNNNCGIHLSWSSNNIIVNNNGNLNEEYGIHLADSSNNNILNNSANSNNNLGIFLTYSSNNAITGNKARNNTYCGIYFTGSLNNIVTGNNANSNNHYGIYLFHSSNNSHIYLNNFMNNNENAGAKDSTNIWNSTEPITYQYYGIEHINYLGNYWSDYTGSDADGDGIGDAPYSINSDKDNYPLMEPWENYFSSYDVNLSCNDTQKSIPPRGTAEYTITVKNIGKITDTINLTLSPWPILPCGWSYGLNKDNVTLLPGESTEVILYVSDLLSHRPGDSCVVTVTGTSQGETTKSDSVTTATTIKQSSFDTSPSANPYPSISGTHNGTIKPSHDIYVTKMYTYPCAGTGGHSEYVWIYGNGMNVSASWNGYQGAGDYHYVVFSVPFTLTLEANVTYNYTIKTGSYPQIHHTDRLETDDGVITCDNFVDTNGKVYTNWIPAIRLE